MNCQLTRLALEPGSPTAPEGSQLARWHTQRGPPALAAAAAAPCPPITCHLRQLPHSLPYDTLDA